MGATSTGKRIQKSVIHKKQSQNLL
jgi:hypothetical protein